MCLDHGLEVISVVNMEYGEESLRRDDRLNWLRWMSCLNNHLVHGFDVEFTHRTLLRG